MIIVLVFESFKVTNCLVTLMYIIFDISINPPVINYCVFFIVVFPVNSSFFSFWFFFPLPALQKVPQDALGAPTSRSSLLPAAFPTTWHHHSSATPPLPSAARDHRRRLRPKTEPPAQPAASPSLRPHRPPPGSRLGTTTFWFPHAGRRKTGQRPKRIHLSVDPGLDNKEQRVY